MARVRTRGVTTSRDLDPASIRRTRIYYLVFFGVFGGGLLTAGIVLIGLSTQSEGDGKRIPGIVLLSMGGFLLLIAGIVAIRLCANNEAPVATTTISMGSPGAGAIMPVEVGAGGYGQTTGVIYPQHVASPGHTLMYAGGGAQPQPTIPALAVPQLGGGGGGFYTNDQPQNSTGIMLSTSPSLHQPTYYGNLQQPHVSPIVLFTK